MLKDLLDINKDIHYKQRLLEESLNKNQLIPRLREEVATIPDINKFINTDNKDIYLDILAQMALYKRATVPTLVGLIYNPSRKLETILNCLKELAENDFLDCQLNNNNSYMVIVKYVVDYNTQRELDMYCYPVPLLLEPETITNSNKNGYHYTYKGSVVLQHKTNKDINLDVINISNKIRYCINTSVLNNLKNTWNLPKGLLGRFESALNDLSKIYLSNNNTFYLTNKYDFRGRLYCQGYHFTTQGNDYQKAMLEFADKEVLVD